MMVEISKWGLEPKAHAILGLSMSCCCSVIFSLLGFGVR